MLFWTITFMLLALVSGVLGFGGIAEISTDLAQISFLVFLVLFIGSIIMGFVNKTRA